MIRPVVRSATWLLFATLLSPSGAFAQPSGASAAGDRIEGRAKFLPLPYVDYDRALGWGGGFIPVLMFNPVPDDTVSPSSMVGGFVMGTTNKTWAAMGFSTLFLDEDKWRVTTAGGTGSVNFQFRLKGPIDGWLPYNTAADFGFAGVDRRVWGDLFVGASYIYAQFDTTVEGIPDSAGTTLHGIGLKSSMDRRENIRYPRQGFVTEAEYRSFPSGLGNESPSNVVELDYNHYLSFRNDNDVLAARAYAGIGLGDLSFNQEFVVGGEDIRGYTQGEFRGKNLLAVQGEYRWNFHRRIGLVGFAGLATVLDAINTEDDGKILPGGGIGFRFTAETETHMNVGLDVAVGRGDWGVYFRFGEAF